MDPVERDLGVPSSTGSIVVAEPSPPPAQPYQPRQTVVREPRREGSTEAARESAVHSEHIDGIVTALAVAQGQFAEVVKTKHADVQSRREGARSYSYDYEALADVIAAVRPGLSQNQLAFTQLPTTTQNGVSVLTILAHGPSGQWLRNRLTLGCDVRDPQAIGSAISYARRYALKAILGIASDTDDDDGERASASMQQRRDASPRPGRRKSEGQRQAERPAEPTPDSPSDYPTIVDVVERGGAYLVKTSDGAVFATRDAAVVTAARNLKEAGTPVDVASRPSSDPSKYCPTITELTPIR